MMLFATNAEELDRQTPPPSAALFPTIVLFTTDADPEQLTPLPPFPVMRLFATVPCQKEIPTTFPETVLLSAVREDEESDPTPAEVLPLTVLPTTVAEDDRQPIPPTFFVIVLPEMSAVEEEQCTPQDPVFDVIVLPDMTGEEEAQYIPPP